MCAKEQVYDLLYEVWISLDKTAAWKTIPGIDTALVLVSLSTTCRMARRVEAYDSCHRIELQRKVILEIPR